MKTLKTISICILIIAVLLIGGIAFAKDAAEKLPVCAVDQVALDLKFDPLFGAPTERECYSKEDYKILKDNLKQSRVDNLKTKGYEFDINDREKLMAVLNYEVKAKGGLSINGANKEKIKTELLKLLD